MSDSRGSPKGVTKSVALAVEKARELRIQRLRTSLETRIENPMATIDSLIAEAADGEMHPELWEKLHVAAIRDGREREVADAYRRAMGGPRMRRLDAKAQTDVLMHAADYFQGICGDLEAADGFLGAVVALLPGHAEAFPRLEARLEKLADDRRLVELYAGVASDPPRPAPMLATQVLNRLVRVKPTDPVADDACKKLVPLVKTNAKLLAALDAHCRATKRPALACELIEGSVADDVAAPAELTTQRRHRLIELYFGDAAEPARAIDHVEKLLDRDPHDGVALRAGDRLMSEREVSSRAAAALQKARRARAQS